MSQEEKDFSIDMYKVPPAQLTCLHALFESSGFNELRRRAEEFNKQFGLESSAKVQENEKIEVSPAIIRVPQLGFGEQTF